MSFVDYEGVTRRALSRGRSQTFGYKLSYGIGLFIVLRLTNA